MNRKQFLTAGPAAAALLWHPFQTLSQPPSIDPYKPELIREFVGAGHGNLARIREMLAEFPNLIYSRWDWGNGDFEEAIEGAGHVGNREIALHLIEKGARPNLFVLTMLGETEIVKSVISRFPSLLHALGAHGFTLLHHAIRGGEHAHDVLEYLKGKGLNQMQVKIK